MCQGLMLLSPCNRPASSLDLLSQRCSFLAVEHVLKPKSFLYLVPEYFHVFIVDLHKAS